MSKPAGALRVRVFGELGDDGFEVGENQLAIGVAAANDQPGDVCDRA